MPIFLQLWLTCFLTLGAAVLGLHIAYRLLGSELGTEGVVNETVIALVASALEALVLWAAVAVIGAPHLYHIVLAAVVAGFVYLVTHLEEMTKLEASIIGATQVALYLAWSLGSAALAG